MTYKERLGLLNIRRRVWGWVSHNHVFGRCGRCRSIAIGGVCPGCGFATVCTHCGRVQRPDGSWAAALLYPNRPVSHGCCPDCLAVHYGASGRRVLDRVRRRAEALFEEGALA